MKYSTADALATLQLSRLLYNRWPRCRHPDGNGDLTCPKQAVQDTDRCLHHTPITEVR